MNKYPREHTHRNILLTKLLFVTDFNMVFDFGVTYSAEFLATAKKLLVLNSSTKLHSNCTLLIKSCYGTEIVKYLFVFASR